MSNDEPYFEGWTLHETLRRVGNALRPAIECRLIVFGRLGSPHANSSYISPAELRGQFSLNQDSLVDQADANCAGRDIFDLRFFPALKAPNVEDILRDFPLKTAFDHYVLGDPEVEHLGAIAVTDYAKLAKVYFAGESRLRYWPFNSDLLLEKGELEDHSEYFHYYPTARTHAAAMALRDRLDALISLLRRRIYCIEGDPFSASDPRVIPASQWLVPALWFDLKTGDIVQERDWDEDEIVHHRFDDGRDNYAVRWRAVMLIRTNRSDPHVRPVHAQTAADRATVKRIETKASSAKACEAWLQTEMRANPEEPKKSKAAWLEDAKQRWPDLSERAFERLWGTSIQEARAFAWSVSGRRKRSD